MFAGSISHQGDNLQIAANVSMVHEMSPIQ
jgi:hypothetical protein